MEKFKTFVVRDQFDMKYVSLLERKKKYKMTLLNPLVRPPI